MGYDCYYRYGNWAGPYKISFASLFGPQKPKPDCGVTVDRTVDGYFVYRCRSGNSEYLHKDGTWHKQCGLPNFYASEREATVAAVLAGMESPEVRELKAVNETAQKRLAAKQAVVDQVYREREAFRAEAANLRRENTELSRADEGKCFRRATACGKIAKGEPCDFPAGVSNCVDAVRKLRADYEAFQKAYISDFDRLNKLAGDCPAGACLVEWAADEIERLREDRDTKQQYIDVYAKAERGNANVLAAIRNVCEGGPFRYDLGSDTLTAVQNLKHKCNRLERLAKEALA